MGEPDVQELMEKGKQAAKAGERDEARTLFFDVIALDPQNFDVWLWLGAIADDPEESVAYLNHALEMNPNSVRAQKGLAWAQDRLAETQQGQAATGDSLESARLAAPPSAEPLQEQAEPELRIAQEATEALPQEALASADGKAEPIATMAVNVEPDAPPAQAAAVAGELPETSTELAEKEIAPEPARAEARPEPASRPNLLQPESPPTETADASTNMDWETILAGLKSFDEATLDGQDQAAGNELPPFPGMAGPEPSPAEEPVTAFSLEQLLSSDGEVVSTPAASAAFDLDQGESDSAQAGTVPSEATSAALFATPPPSEETAPTETLDSWVDRLGAQQTMPLSEMQGRVGTLVAEGRRLMEAGEPGEAIPKLTEALQIDPNSVDAREQLGVALYQKGRDEDAAREFRTIIGLKPDHAEAHANLGFILAEQGRSDEAIDAFDAAIRHDSTLVEAHLGLAELYQNRNRLQDAVAEWKLASTLRPDLIEVHKFLGDAYVALGRIEEAVLEYRVILERDQQNAYAHQRLGEIFIRTDHLLDAAREFRRAIELDDTVAEAHYGLGVSMAEQGQHTQAIAHLERALALRPDYPEARSSIEDLQRQLQGATEQGTEAVAAGVSGEGKKRWGIFRWGKK